MDLVLITYNYMNGTLYEQNGNLVADPSRATVYPVWFANLVTEKRLNEMKKVRPYTLEEHHVGLALEPVYAFSLRDVAVGNDLYWTGQDKLYQERVARSA